MVIDLDTGEWPSLETKYGTRRGSEFATEKATVSKYLNALAGALGGIYQLEKPLAVGGTGVVVTGYHQRLKQRVIVKFSRPNLQAAEASMVEKETRILPQLDHPNIIRVLDVGEIRIPDVPLAHYIVEPFITGSKPLYTHDKEKVEGTWLHQALSDARRRLPDPAGPRRDDLGSSSHLINDLLGRIASLLSQWISLLAHLHHSRSGTAPEGFLYLDVKSENVLVDDHDHLTSIDYGSVEPLSASDPASLEVFFTDRYAHPDLLRRKRDNPSSNRVRGALRRNELRQQHDHYALGISMLEILDAVGELKPHVAPQLPLYRALHLLATRLLDGRNRKAGEPAFSHASQVFPTLREPDYMSLGYTDLADTARDLRKERGEWSLEGEVPELATYSKDIVRVVPGFNTVLTQRLRQVIEHPIVARLKYVTQLGLVSLVYPTADHSRYDHALGSYTYATNYIKSLFNDLGNPLFRNLVSTEDLNTVLLAALLHDLGQYPLAHDLEEVAPRIFTHHKMGLALLGDDSTDGQGRTMKDLITKPENGWGVTIERLREVLGAQSRSLTEAAQRDTTSLKADVLAAIIDGPIDADKADYIARDSARCELPYGSQLDVERLLRVLTVAVIPDEAEGRKRVTLGVYDKGLASARTFGLARYQLLATVYWHHTSRIAKAMLQYATALGLPREAFAPAPASGAVEGVETRLREMLVDFVKALVPPFDLLRKAAAAKPARETLVLDGEPSEDVLGSVIATEAASAPQDGDSDWYPGVAWTDWLMLRWIGALPNASAKSANLVRGLQTRHLYKRIATISRGGGQDLRALEELSWPARIELSEKLHVRVRERLGRSWTDVNTGTSMERSEFDRLCGENLLVLVDIPQPSKKVGYERPLGVVPELKEKSYHQDARQATEDKEWRGTMEEMVRGIAPVRVLCHPKVRNLVSAAYAPVEQSIVDELRQALK